MERSSNSLASPQPAKKPGNGFIGPERPPWSKQKRSLDGDRETVSPSKRPRLSDDDNDIPSPQSTKSEKSREPLKTVINGNPSSSSPRQSGQNSGKPFQPHSSERPKLPHQSHLSYPPPKTAISRPGATDVHFTRDPATSQRSGKPTHRINPLQTTNSNPYADNDPFAAGVLLGQQRQSEKQKSHPRPKFPGIGSQLTPGSNKAFLQNKTLSRRNDLGIEFDKNRSRR
jgi:hypothetical protein